MPISDLSYRLILSFITLLILTRIKGRKQISQLTFFNFVSAIAIGTIGASLAINPSISVRNGMLGLIGWSAITVIIDFINIKSEKARSVIQGQPIIVVKDGQIMEGALRQARLDINTLNLLLRKKNTFTISDVDYAIFETDGSLSVLKKEHLQPLTKNDLHIQQNMTRVFPIATTVISDGGINYANLEKLNLTKDWLDQQLLLAGIQSLDDVFYAEVKQDGMLYIDKKQDFLH